jgi:hypothetical protein
MPSAFCRRHFFGYISSDKLAEEARLTVAETETALNKLPVSVKEEAGTRLYRLEDSCRHVPPLLSFLYRF